MVGKTVISLIGGTEYKVIGKWSFDGNNLLKLKNVITGETISIADNVVNDNFIIEGGY